MIRDGINPFVQRRVQQCNHLHVVANAPQRLRLVRRILFTSSQPVIDAVAGVVLTIVRRVEPWICSSRTRQLKAVIRDGRPFGCLNGWCSENQNSSSHSRGSSTS